MSSDTPYSDDDVFASLAQRGWDVDPEDDGRDLERNLESSINGAFWYPGADRRLSMPTRGDYAKGWPQGAVVHFTAGRCLRGDADAEATIRYGAEQRHCYFCISTTGRVYQTAPLNRWGSHAGESHYPGLGISVSKMLVGIEICNAGRLKHTSRGYEPWWNKDGGPANTYFQDADVRTVDASDNILSAGTFHRYTQQQESSLIALLLWLKAQRPDIFKFEHVLGHDEVSPRRKDDPGGALSSTMPAFRRALMQQLDRNSPVVAASGVVPGSAPSAPTPASTDGGLQHEAHGPTVRASVLDADFEILRRLATSDVPTQDEIEQARARRDYEEADVDARESARIVAPQLSDDDVRSLGSEEACRKIIEFEVSSEADYRQRYERPILPGVDSGITIGIGYDLGHNTPAQFRKDFAGLISDADINALSTVCGLKGEAARPHLAGLRSQIAIPYAVANKVFRSATILRYGRDVLRTFPNSAELKGHCFGALLSLVYNRGSSLSGDRRREMRAIAEMTAARRWDGIPQQFLEMRRLWQGDPNARGLLKRRAVEAALFSRGLELMRSVVAANDTASSFESLSPSDRAAIEGDGFYYRELDETAEALERKDPAWDKVVWASDDKSPDYSHIPDRSLSGTTFEFGSRELELLFEANGFLPSREHGRIVFALRGAELVAGSITNPQPMSPQEDREKLTLRETRPNHQSFRCVIGVYNTENGRLSGYTASTVPNPKAVASFVAGGDPSNMMLTGCYEFVVGWHQQNRDQKKIPGCLIESGRRKAVLRTKNNYTYELTDIVHDTMPGDNINPGKSEGPFPFSSWGCLVLKGSVDPVTGGNRENVKHTGEWAHFRKSLGLPDAGTGRHGQKLDAVLLTGLEAAIATHVLQQRMDYASDPFRLQLQRLRQGSRGPRVARLRAALNLPDGQVFTSEVAAKLADLQRAKTGGVHGLLSPQLDAALGLGIFRSDQVVASKERTTIAATRQTSEREALAFELGAVHEATQGRAPLSEAAYNESLMAKVSELGTRALLSTGNALMREAERALRSYVCERDGLGKLADRDNIRNRIDAAAATSVSALKHVLTTVLRYASFSYVRYDLMHRIVSYIVDEIILPHTGSAGNAVVQQLDGGVAWLCQRWEDRLAGSDGVLAAAPNTGPLPAQPSATPMPTPPLGPSAETVRLLGVLQSAAAGDSPDVPGVRSSIRQLRDHLRRSGEVLPAEQNQQLLDILCDSRFMEQIAGTPDADPYVVMDDIRAALSATPPDRAKAESRTRELTKLLANARMRVQPEPLEATIDALRRRRMPEAISRLADRVLTRQPDAALLGRIGPHYALSLIDTDRIVAGIEVLHATLEKGQLSAAAAAQTWGGIGRAHKQIYVNHVKSPSDAIALRETMAPQLARAIDAYSQLYDPARPGANYWHGINLVALLRRAESDRVNVGNRQDAATLANGIISALEPTIAATDDYYAIATLAEAYLSIGDVKKASYYYAEFAAHRKVGPFELNSAIRQLEEVWQLEAGREGADTLLIGLKAALGQKENGRITLTMNERLAIAGANFIPNQKHFEEKLESKVAGGRFVPLAYLQLVVKTGMAVAAVKQRSDGAGTRVPGGGETIGTGFLIDGSALGLAAGRSYLLTNAHVMWDPSNPDTQGQEDYALAPAAADIVFEGSAPQGPAGAYRVARVLWQSPSALHDACLVELDRPVANIDPLTLAPPETKLDVDDGAGNKGTPLTVVGHPQGGKLSIGITGGIEEINARLVDQGPRAGTSNPVFLHYSVPTEPGNSGSPVLEATGWKVVGLHHAGFNETKGRPRLGGKAGSNFANEGICIQSIRRAVAEKIKGSLEKKKRGWF